MSDADRAQFESDVNNGLVVLPQQVKIGGTPTAQNGAQPIALPKGVIDAYNMGAIDPYNVKAMPEADRKQLDEDVKNGLVHVPSGTTLNQSYMSTVGKLKELFTGDLRSDPKTKGLPDYSSLPELQPHTQPGVEHPTDGNSRFLANIGSLTGGPADIAKSITHNFPNVKAYQDDHGNVVLRSAENGKDYLITPGATAADIARAIGLGAAFAPASGATTIGGAVARGALTETALQGVNSLAGGREFDPYAIAETGALTGAVPVVGSLVKGVASGLRSAGGKMLDRLVPATEEAPKPPATATETPAAPTPAPTPSAAPSVPTAPAEAAQPPQPPVPTEAPKSQTFSPSVINPQGSVPPNVSPQDAAIINNLIEKDKDGGDYAAKFFDLLRKAGQGDQKAFQALVNEIKPDKETIEAANRQGVLESMTPAQLASNQQARAIIQGVNTKPGAAGRALEQQGFEDIKNKFGDLIDKLGGTDNLSLVNQEVKSGLTGIQKELDQKAKNLYGQLEDVPKLSNAPATETLKFIGDRLDSYQGDMQALSPMERRVLSLLSPKEATAQNAKTLAQQSVELPDRMTAAEYRDYIANSTKANNIDPSYALLDRVRKDVGSALYKSQGPFKDEDSGLLKKLYGTLSDDQETSLKALQDTGKPEFQNVTGVWEQANQAVAARKEVEDNLASLFGKQVDGSLLPKLKGATAALATGDETKLNNFIKAIPEDQRQRVLASGLSQAFIRNGEMKFTDYARWYEALQQNKPAMNALMSNLPDYARDALQDWYKISKGISRASAERIPTGVNTVLQKQALQQGGTVGMIGRGLLRLVVDEGVTAAGSTIGGPGGAVVGSLIGQQIGSSIANATKSKAVGEIQEFLNSPALSIAVKALDKGDTATAAQILSKNAKFSSIWSKVKSAPGVVGSAAKVSGNYLTKERDVSGIRAFLNWCN